MKTKFTIGLILATLLAFSPGCSTTPSGGKVIDPEAAGKLAPILSGTVAGAVVAAYQKNPKTEPIVGALSTALEEFLVSTNLNPVALQTKLNALPIPALKTAEAQMVLTPLLAIYKGFADQKVKEGVDANPGLKILIQAMIDGLKQGQEGIRQMKSAPTASIDSDLDSLKIIATALEQRLKQEIQRMEDTRLASAR